MMIYKVSGERHNISTDDNSILGTVSLRRHNISTDANGILGTVNLRTFILVIENSAWKQANI
jgi:hypothetical protein